MPNGKDLPQPNPPSNKGAPNGGLETPRPEQRVPGIPPAWEGSPEIPDETLAKIEKVADKDPDAALEEIATLSDTHTEEKPSLAPKEQIVKDSYVQLIATDLVAERKGDESVLFCEDNFLPLSAYVIVEKDILVSTDIDNTPALSFATETVEGATPIVNRRTSGRHRTLSLFRPIKIGHQIYWEISSKGNGPTGHARREEYQHFTETQPDYPLGLLGKWNCEEEIEITRRLNQMGVRTSVALGYYELSPDRLEKILASVHIVQPTPENYKYVHKPYNLHREIEQLKTNEEGNPTIITRAGGGDRLGNVFAIERVDQERMRLLIQANAAMLGYEIDYVGVNQFMETYTIPEELHPDINLLANISPDSTKDIAASARSLIRVNAYLQIRNTLLIRDYNNSHSDKQIRPSFKVGDMDFQGRCYDFESSQGNTQRFTQEDAEERAITSLKNTAEQIEANQKWEYGTLQNDVELLADKYLRIR